MRNFFSHWKILLALILLIVLAVLTVAPGDARADPPLAQRLRQHLQALAADGQDRAGSDAFQRAARHIETSLAAGGYRMQRQHYQSGGLSVRNIVAARANLVPGARPARIFIVGARYQGTRGEPGARGDGNGTAAVLELARLLKDLRPATGTEIRFVFFVNEAPPWLGSQDRAHFIAFVGTRESSAPVRQALAAFGAASDFPAPGLAAPSYLQGITLSHQSSLGQHADPALMITDTAFLRYPYHHAAGGSGDPALHASIARVVTGLARTLAALAGSAEG